MNIKIGIINSINNRKLLLFLICFLFLMKVTPAKADMVWPALVLSPHLLSWQVISAGLLIEFIFIRYIIIKCGILKSILVTVVMNAFSTGLGIILIPLAGLGALIPASIIGSVVNYGIFDLVVWLGTGSLAVFINALIEFLVIKIIFRTRIGWRGFWLLSLANALSVGIAFIGLTT